MAVDHQLPTVVILAGGLATRMRPATEKIPKSLLTVANKPFIHHQLSLLQTQGITSVVLCVGFLGEMIEAYVGSGAQYGMQVQYVYDGDTLRGTGGAIKNALPLLDKTFYILYGDSYLDCDYSAMHKTYASAKQSILMTVYKNNNVDEVSNIRLTDQGFVIYDKFNPQPNMHYVDYGVSLVAADIFTAFPATGPFDLADLFTIHSKKQDIIGFEVFKRFYEIGSFSGRSALETYLSTAV